ncbi:hypothetical protein ACFQ1I_33995 [Kitasatospora arboriphila]
MHLRARYPGLEQELHRRAAHWLHDAGRLADALPHAAAAGDWETAASWLVDDLAVGQLLAGLDAARLGALFARMPEQADGRPWRSSGPPGRSPGGTSTAGWPTSAGPTNSPRPAPAAPPRG